MINGALDARAWYDATLAALRRKRRKAWRFAESGTIDAQSSAAISPAIEAGAVPVPASGSFGFNAGLVMTPAPIAPLNVGVIGLGRRKCAR